MRFLLAAAALCVGSLSGLACATTSVVSGPPSDAAPPDGGTVGDGTSTTKPKLFELCTVDEPSMGQRYVRVTHGPQGSAIYLGSSAGVIRYTLAETGPCALVRDTTFAPLTNVVGPFVVDAAGGIWTASESVHRVYPGPTIECALPPTTFHAARTFALDAKGSAGWVYFAVGGWGSLSFDGTSCTIDKSPTPDATVYASAMFYDARDRPHVVTSVPESDALNASRRAEVQIIDPSTGELLQEYLQSSSSSVEIVSATRCPTGGCFVRYDGDVVEIVTYSSGAVPGPSIPFEPPLPDPLADIEIGAASAGPVLVLTSGNLYRVTIE